MPRLPQFIYVHGFNSSPQSFKAQFMMQEFERLEISENLTVPELSHWPLQAMDQLTAIVKKHDDVLLIGSSLGGFYATCLTEQFAHARAVLVNPAVAPHRLLKSLLGETKNYYSGESYTLTLEHLNQLKALYSDHLAFPERLLLMVQEGDESLDYRDAVTYYAKAEQIVQPGGNHGFENFDKVMPLIFRYANREYP